MSVNPKWKQKNACFLCPLKKGYKGPYDEERAENVILEGEQSQTHVREDEILSQEVKGLKELQGKHIHCAFRLEMYAHTSRCK